MPARVDAQVYSDHWVYYVKADTGDDADPGTIRQPFKTLNWALRQAWYVLNTPGYSIVDVKIKVLWSVTPIAPEGFGGYEPDDGGWRTNAEIAAGCLREPFPIRMIDGVDIIGIAKPPLSEEEEPQKPVITINETLLGTPPGSGGAVYTDWSSPCTATSPVEVRAVVLGASDCKLQGFQLDGNQLIASIAPDSNYPGLFVADAQDFELVNCEIKDWYDEVYLKPSALDPPDPLDPAPPLETLSVVVSNCVLSGAGPLNLDIPGAQPQGHAALWALGPGHLTVDIRDQTELSNSHDALECDGRTWNSTIALSLVDCDIKGNENGVEGVGVGKINFEVDGCRFTNNYNRPIDGTPFPSGGVEGAGTTAAIWLRGATFDPPAWIRRTTFENFTIGIGWRVPEVSPFPGVISQLDLGTAADPGGNSFCLSAYCDFTDGPLDLGPKNSDPLGQQLPFGLAIVQAPTSSTTPTLKPGRIDAIGNYWLGFNQGSFGGSHGRFLINPTPPINPNWPRTQLPFACQLAPGIEELRNYSLEHPDAILELGDMSTLPPPPDASIECMSCSAQYPCAN